ncbi:hypothetical protein F2A37_16400 [Pseudomonas chlororaphis]|uniref:DUF1799 domain-containing protein n=1 Tax=Pseudomonas chlororaphis TaxID=587753 RepID=UPI0009B87866|nr:DUF1799 domain-containing protein [Pseudomonas chlororaphis]KAA5842248.1 hypothetical protein F2A37_16400 [Pseudomonas chlororaphis]
MLRKDLPEEVIEVFPENWKAFVVMESMGTQWRTGTGGAIGLDYGVLPSVMRLIGVPAKERAAIFQDIRVMEAEALAVMAEARETSP